MTKCTRNRTNNCEEHFSLMNQTTL